MGDYRAKISNMLMHIEHDVRQKAKDAKKAVTTKVGTAKEEHDEKKNKV